MGRPVARSNPIRYIVREASHRLHCAQPARSRRAMVGIHHVLFSFPPFSHMRSRDFVSQPTLGMSSERRHRNSPPFVCSIPMLNEAATRQS